MLKDQAEAFLDGAQEPAASGSKSAQEFIDRPVVRFDDPSLDAAAKDAEKKYGLPDGLIVALKNAGERSNSDQVSPAGARGVMQFMPENLRKYGVRDAEDPAEAIDAAGRYLADTMKQYSGNTRAVIADYNGGPTQANEVLAGRQPKAKETSDYVSRVEAYMARAKGPAPSGAGSQDVGMTRTAAETFLDTPADVGAAPPPAAKSGGKPQAARAAAESFLDAPADDELARAARPAQMIATRGGQPIVVPDNPYPTFDPDSADRDSVIMAAPWTGKGGVIESLPGQLVAGTAGASANLRRMAAQESLNDRAAVVASAPVTETRGGAATAIIRPSALARQDRLMSQDAAELANTKTDADFAKEELRRITPVGMNTPQQAVSSLAQSALPTAAGIAAGILTRSPELAMAIAGGGGARTQAGSTYGEAIEKGATHRQASVAASIDAILEGAGEALPLKVAMKPGNTLMARMVHTMGAEAGQEAATQMAQDLNAYLSYNPNLTLNEAWDNLKVAAVAGAMGGAGYGALGHVATAGRQPGQQPAPRIEPTFNPGAEPTAVDAAAQQTATNPANTVPTPTPAQQEAGNFRVGHATVGGLDISIEHAAGTQRRPDGPPLNAHYGYVKDVAARAADGEHVDLFVRPGTPDTYDGDVFVIDQLTKDGDFDEPKVMVGYNSADEARNAYLQNYPPGWESRVGGVTSMTMDEFKAKLEDASAFAAPQPAGLGSTGTPENTQENQSRAQVQPAEYPSLGTAPASEPAGSVAAALDRLNATIEASNQQLAAHDQRVVANQVSRPVVVDHEPEFHAMPDGRMEPRMSKSPTAAANTPPAQQTPSPGQHAAVSVISTPYTGGAQAHGGAAQPEPIDSDAARPDAIRNAIRDLFNVPINERRIPMRRALGIYKIKAQAIRVRNRNDIEVIAHEVGHHISETNQEVRKLMTTHEAEMLRLSPNAYANEPKRVRVEEGFAEFIRHFLNDHKRARQLAPGFSVSFDSFINKQGLRPALSQVQQQISAWNALDPAERILAKVGNQKEPPFKWVSRVFGKNNLIFQLLDRWHPLKMMVADLNPGVAAGKNPYIAARLLSGTGAMIEDWLTTGTIPFNMTRRADVKNYGKSLRDILLPVSHDLKGFKAYLIARRADELLKQGKENLFSREEVAHALGKLHSPEFAAAAEEVYAYNDRLIDYAVEGGLLSPEVAAKFREMSKAYVPFFRESDGDSMKGGGTKNPFHRLIGGMQNLRDPLSNIIENTAGVIMATNRNAVLIQGRELARTINGGGRWIEDIPMPKGMVSVPSWAVVDALKKQGIQLSAADVQALDQMQNLVANKPLDNKDERIVILKVKGEPVAVQINNPILAKALQAFEPADLGLPGDILALPGDLLRAGVVLWPDYMARNFARDTISGYIQSQKGMLPVTGTIGGFREIIIKSEIAKLYRAFGGAHADMWKGDGRQARLSLERLAKAGGFNPLTILNPLRMIEFLQKLGSLSEAGTRVAEFKRSAAPGDIDSLVQGAYDAREVSTDFGMHGQSQALRMLTRITPFLNPGMQGFYKLARTASDRTMLTLLRGSMLAAFSVMMFLRNKDEDWYQEIEQWEKDTFWHMDLGMKTDDGKVMPIRIPKPFEWGAVFGSVPEGLTQVAVDKKGDKFAERMGSIFKNVFGLRLVPTGLLVPHEISANKSMFSGRPIVPEGREDLEPDLQYGPHNTLIARKVGEVANISPAQIDHAVRGFLGSLGVFATTLSDLTLRATGDYPSKPSRTVRDIPILGAFVHDPTGADSKYVTDFYALLNKAREKSRSDKIYEGAKEEAYYQKNKDLIDDAKSLDQDARDMATERKGMREVMDDKDLLPDEKRRRLNEHAAMIKEIAKGVMTDLERGRAAAQK